MEIKLYIESIVGVFVEELNENLIGVYLHGSLAMGCFNPEKSDIDLLVIVKENSPNVTKIKIINKLKMLTEGHRNQLEMSIIVEKYLIEFVYPTPFELHYFHPRYLIDKNFICGGKGFYDPDIAGHIVVTQHRGITLVGTDIKKVFKPIDKQFYINSIFNDIEDASKAILQKPVYFTLNLCRVLYFLKEGEISSKREGGEWGKYNLPQEYEEIITQCLDLYNGSSMNIDCNDHELVGFADWMVKEIKQLAKIN